jgi:hypothetical protein
MTGLQYPAPNIRFSMDNPMADGSVPFSGEPFPSQEPFPVWAKLWRERERRAVSHYVIQFWCNQGKEWLNIQVKILPSGFIKCLKNNLFK